MGADAKLAGRNQESPVCGGLLLHLPGRVTLSRLAD